MHRRISFSSDSQSIDSVIAHQQDVISSLEIYFSDLNPSFALTFSGYSQSEVQVELDSRKNEAEYQASFFLLAAIEALFRIDYLERCQKRLKDNISLELRKIYRAVGPKASFEKEILEAWKTTTSGSNGIIGDLRGAFRFRHWLAHGRYWQPKLGRAYDFFTVQTLAQQVVSSFHLKNI